MLDVHFPLESGEGIGERAEDEAHVHRDAHERASEATVRGQARRARTPCAKSEHANRCSAAFTHCNQKPVESVDDRAAQDKRGGDGATTPVDGGRCRIRAGKDEGASQHEQRPSPDHSSRRALVPRALRVYLQTSHLRSQPSA